MYPTRGRGNSVASRGVFTATRGRRLNAFGQSVTERELQKQEAAAEQEAARIAAEERNSRIMARMASGKEFVPEAVRLEEKRLEHERQRDQYIKDEKEKADSIEEKARLHFEKEASDNLLKDYRMPDYNITYDMSDYSTFPDYINAKDYENAEKEKADFIEKEARLHFEKEAAAAAALKNSLENYDMTGYDGGKRKKKKYTQRRQKKQRRRYRHRRSTKKYHRK